MIASWPTFLLDANVFIEAARRYYAFDLAPGFWTCLEQNAAAGKICSIDRIQGEIIAPHDLATWSTMNFAQYFRSSTDQAVTSQFAAIMTSIQGNTQYAQRAQHVFANAADGWLVAFALVHNCIVVTQETFDEGTRNRIKIPNVCNAFGVDWIDTFQMMRQLNIRLT